MKNAIIISMFLAACFFCSCQKEAGLKPATSGSASLNTGGGVAAKTSSPAPVVSTVPPIDTVTSKLPIGTLISVGTWQVTSYVEKSVTSADKFSGYTFTFNAAGKITANQNGKISSGTWLYQNAVFYYGVPVYGTSPDGFVINLGTAKPLSLLSKNLFIGKKTTTNFYLHSVNPAEDTHITFTKIAN